MPTLNYVSERDDLEVKFNDIETPQIIKLSSGIMLEFDDDDFGAIVLPNFFQMIHRQPTSNTNFEFLKIDNDILKIKVDEQTVNIKLDFSEIENC